MREILFDTMGCSYKVTIVPWAGQHFVVLSKNDIEVARFDIMLVWDMVKEYLASLAMPSGIARRASEAVAALKEGEDYAPRH